MTRGVNRNEEKARREREVFLAFAEAAGLALVGESLRSREPPEPDLLCEIQGRGIVAFELVELIDQDFRERLASMGRFDRELRAYPEKIAPSLRAALLAKYRNAAVGVTFKLLPLRDLVTAIPELIRWLLEDVPADANAMEVALPGNLRLLLERVAIRRPMPEFDIGNRQRQFWRPNV